MRRGQQWLRPLCLGGLVQRAGVENPCASPNHDKREIKSRCHGWAKRSDKRPHYDMIQIKLGDRTGGPAATSGPEQLALTNHDKESFNFGVMAEASVLPLACGT